MRKRPVGLGLVRICNTKCIWQRYRVFLTLDGESQQPSLYIRTEWRSNVQTSPVFLFSFKSFFGLQGKPSPPKPCFCLAVKQKQHMALEVLLNSVLTHFAWRGIVCAQHSHGDFCSWALRATLLIFWTPFSCRRGVGTFLLIDRGFFFVKRDVSLLPVHLTIWQICRAFLCACLGCTAQDKKQSEVGWEALQP